MNDQHITLLEQYQHASPPTQHYLARMLWEQVASRVRGKGYSLYCGHYAHQFTFLGHSDGWPRDWSASYDGMLWSWFWLEQNGPTLVPGTRVRIQARGNCYCSEIPCEDDQNTTCDYCKYNGQIGTLAKINEHAPDGDFYGVVFPGGKPVYFWQAELQITVGDTELQEEHIMSSEQRKLLSPLQKKVLTYLIKTLHDEVRHMSCDEGEIPGTNKAERITLTGMLYEHWKDLDEWDGKPNEEFSTSSLCNLALSWLEEGKS